MVPDGVDGVTGEVDLWFVGETVPTDVPGLVGGDEVAAGVAEVLVVEDVVALEGVS